MFSNAAMLMKDIGRYDYFFFEIKEIKITRGHNYTLVKKQVDWMLESIHFHRGPSMY